MTATLKALEVQLPHPSADPLSAGVGARPLPDVESLTKQMLSGNETAYRIFHDAYFNRLWRYLVVVAAGNEDAAREALQATLLRVARHIKIFRDDQAFWSWLTVVARTAYADENRKRRRYFSFLDRFTRHSERAPDNELAGDADGKLNDLLKAHMAALPVDEQKLLENKYFERRSVREIAMELKTTEKAIESKLSRIRRKLKGTLLERLKDEPES